MFAIQTTRYFLLICVFILQIQVCSSQSVYATGKIIDTIFCNASKTNSYALYLPTSYVNTTTKYAVLYLHDPAARAKHAIQVFIDAAEKNNFILVCSNETNNFGKTDSMILQSIEMQKHVESIFRVDTNRRYIGGFSGGSRLAFTIANYLKNDTGILACGAGLPGRKEMVTYIPDQSIVAIVYGKKDMNYLEMQTLKQQLQQSQRTAKQFEFDGGHEWPNDSTAISILDWFNFQYSKTDATKKIFLDSLLYLYELEMNHYLSIGDYFAANQIYSDHMQELSFSKNYDSIFQSNIAKAQIQSIQKILDKEQEQRNLYTEYLSYRIAGAIIYDSTKLKNDQWWKQKINQIKKNMESPNTYESESASRLFDVLWRSSWENGDFFFESKAYAEAQSLYYLLTVIYPENPYAWIYLARAEAMLKNDSLALKYIATGFEKGYSNIDELLADPAFLQIKETSKFKKITSKK